MRLQATDADDLGPAGLRVVLGDERHLAVVVDEADPDEPLVRGPLVEAQVREVAGRPSPRRASAWNSTTSGSSSGRIGRIGPSRHRALSTADVLARVRADGEPRQLVLGHVGVVQHDPRVERDEPLRRGEQRVDVDLADPALLDDELAEPDEQLLEGVEVDRRRPADALQAP